MKSPHEFFLAISETAAWPEHLEASRADAINYLAKMAEEIFARLDAAGAKGRERDNIIAWEFMLKGVQLRLRRDALRESEQIQRAITNPGPVLVKEN